MIELARLQKRREEFGALVKALRCEQVDEDGKTWTHGYLANKCGNWSKRTIERIEQGTLKKLDVTILNPLAEAFHLTPLERKEFFSMAVEGNEDNTILQKDPNTVLDELISLIEKMSLPAFIVDVYGDVIAANRLIIELLEIPQSLLLSAADMVGGYNVMRMLFDEDSTFRKIVGYHWQTSAIHNMHFFRRISLKYRRTDYYKCIFNQLRTYNLFIKYWTLVNLGLGDNDGEYNEMEHYQYHHPQRGRLEYIAITSATITKVGELYLTTYVPASSDTKSLFNKLFQDFGDAVHRFASWPDKQDCTSQLLHE